MDGGDGLESEYEIFFNDQIESRFKILLTSSFSDEHVQFLIKFDSFLRVNSCSSNKSREGG